jgi:hypothetical protein
MHLGHAVLCILTLTIFTPCAQMFVRPRVFICAALTIATAKVISFRSTVKMAKDASSFAIIVPELSLESYLELFSHAIGSRQAPL